MIWYVLIDEFPVESLIYCVIFSLTEHARLNVWILDGDGYHKDLLNYVVNADCIRNIVVIIAVDISRPWTIMDSLDQWTRILREHLHKLKLSAKELNEIEENCKMLIGLSAISKIILDLMCL